MKRVLILIIVMIGLIFPFVLKSQTSNEKDTSKFDIKQSGYTNISEIGFGCSGDLKFNLRTINGYLISPRFSIGLGIGYENYHLDEILTTMPFFLDLRFNFPCSKFTPYYYFDGGYTTILSPLDVQQGESYFGRLYLSGGIGVKISISKAKIFILD